MSDARASVADLRGALVLSSEAFADLCSAAEVLETKQGLPAVLAHRDGDGQPLVIKVWRRDRGFWATWVRRDHVRFRKALLALAARNVRVPRYRAHGRVQGSELRFVVYEWMAGEPLRARPEQVDLAALARLVADLHARGVYFRGLHLGNVIRDPDGRLGLIDLQDVRWRNRRLSVRQRARNLAILCAHPRDRAFMMPQRWSDLVLAYAEAAGLGVAGTAPLRERVRRQMARRTDRRAARRRRRGLPPLPAREPPNCH